MGDPAISVSYHVTVDGFIPLGFWNKVEGLGMEGRQPRRKRPGLAHAPGTARRGWPGSRVGGVASGARR